MPLAQDRTAISVSVEEHICAHYYYLPLLKDSLMNLQSRVAINTTIVPAVGDETRRNSDIEAGSRMQGGSMVQPVCQTRRREILSSSDA